MSFVRIAGAEAAKDHPDAGIIKLGITETAPTRSMARKTRRNILLLACLGIRIAGQTASSASRKNLGFVTLQVAGCRKALRTNLRQSILEHRPVHL